VNTSSTRIELTWNVRQSSALTDEQRARVIAALASRLSDDGTLRIVASESRSQRRNRDAAEERLAATVRRALAPRKPRKRTKPSRAAKQARLDEKRRHSEKKRQRKPDYE
jgi:ribosome-associated protein